MEGDNQTLMRLMGEVALSATLLCEDTEDKKKRLKCLENARLWSDEKIMNYLKSVLSDEMKSVLEKHRATAILTFRKTVDTEYKYVQCTLR